MSNWKTDKITIDNGEVVVAQFPIIISASRSTDIPAFYADWFFHRLSVGYSAWTNPFNGKKSYISYSDARFIVFWSKNPKPLIPYLEELRCRDINCYIQYTLNNYDNDSLEPNVPPVDERIATFKTLVEKLGSDAVIWRFDPLVLTNLITVDSLLEKLSYVGNQLKGYTKKLVFSFVDISEYSKVRKNLEHAHVNYRLWTEEEMVLFAQQLADMNNSNSWNYELATCAEKIDLSDYGIEQNRCIDDNLMVRLAWQDKKLMEFLNVEIGQPLFPDPGAIKLTDTEYAMITKHNSDKGQRKFCGCGCIMSKDIGQYNTCVHGCEYCYANDNKRIAQSNYNRHLLNPFGDTIDGL